MSWFSPLAHIVDTDPISALQRLAVVVDCANGVGAVLDPNEYDFALRARASVGPDRRSWFSAGEIRLAHA